MSGQEGHHQAMDVVQGQSMQQAVIWVPSPRLAQSAGLGRQAFMGV